MRRGSGAEIPAAGAKAPAEGTLSGLHALLVDDNAVSQIDAVGSLETLGCRVDIASSGQEAIGAAGSRPFDFILIDVAMPHMDGLVAASEIRQREGHNTRTPIIGLSAFALAAGRRLAVTAGMDDMIAKPLSVSVLVETVARHVRLADDTNSGEVPVTAGHDRHFDGPVLTSAMGGLDADMRRQLLTEFRKDVVTQTELLVCACRELDWTTVESAGCALKGLSGAFGARSLHERSNSIVAMCSDGNTSGLRSEVGALEAMTRQVFESLAAWE